MVFLHKAGVQATYSPCRGTIFWSRYFYPWEWLDIEQVHVGRQPKYIWLSWQSPWKRLLWKQQINSWYFYIKLVPWDHFLLQVLPLMGMTWYLAGICRWVTLVDLVAMEVAMATVAMETVNILKNATSCWHWARLVMCTCDMHYLRYEPIFKLLTTMLCKVLINCRLIST